MTFDLKISYVKKLPCLEAHSIPYSQKKFQKITAILDASSSVTKSPKSHFGGKEAWVKETRVSKYCSNAIS
jgi:hypothetical protein